MAADPGLSGRAGSITEQVQLLEKFQYLSTASVMVDQKSVLPELADTPQITLPTCCPVTLCEHQDFERSSSSQGSSRMEGTRAWAILQL